MKKQIFFFCFCALLFSCQEKEPDENRPGRYTINAIGDVLDTQTGRVYYLDRNNAYKVNDQISFIDITPPPGMIPKRKKEPPRKTPATDSLAPTTTDPLAP